MTTHEPSTRWSDRGKDLEAMVSVAETGPRTSKQSLPIRNDGQQADNTSMDRTQVLRHDAGSTDLGLLGGADSVGDGGRSLGITQWDVCVDGIFIKQISVPKDVLVPQHTHTYDHHSMLAKGKVMVWRDDENMGVFEAPMPIFIRAGVRHTFLAMEDALIYCIHNLHGQEDVDIIAGEK